MELFLEILKGIGIVFGMIIGLIAIACTYSYFVIMFIVSDEISSAQDRMIK